MTALIRITTPTGPRTLVVHDMDAVVFNALVASDGVQEVLNDVPLPGTHTIAEIVAERDRELDRELKAITKRKARAASVTQLRRKVS